MKTKWQNAQKQTDERKKTIFEFCFICSFFSSGLFWTSRNRLIMDTENSRKKNGNKKSKFVTEEFTIITRTAVSEKRKKKMKHGTKANKISFFVSDARKRYTQFLQLPDSGGLQSPSPLALFILLAPWLYLSPSHHLSLSFLHSFSPSPLSLLPSRHHSSHSFRVLLPFALIVSDTIAISMKTVFFSISCATNRNKSENEQNKNISCKIYPVNLDDWSSFSAICRSK